MAILPSVPPEALADDLLVASGVTGAVVVAPFAADEFGRADSPRVQIVFGKVGVALLAAAGVGAREVEATRVFGTIVELGVCALVKVLCNEAIEVVLGGVEFSSTQAVVVAAQVALEDVLEPVLVSVVR